MMRSFDEKPLDTKNERKIDYPNPENAKQLMG
jgi:hypothetical protein